MGTLVEVAIAALMAKVDGTEKFDTCRIAAMRGIASGWEKCGLKSARTDSHNSRILLICVSGSVPCCNCDFN